VRLNQWLVRKRWAIELRTLREGRFFSTRRTLRPTSTDSGEVVSRSTGPAQWNKKTAKLPANARRQISRAVPVPRSSGHATGLLYQGKDCEARADHRDRGIYHLEGCRSYGAWTTPNAGSAQKKMLQAAGYRSI